MPPYVKPTVPPAEFDYEPIRKYAILTVSPQKVEQYCRGPKVACAIPRRRIIVISDELTPDQRKEILRHEKAHLNGWLDCRETIIDQTDDIDLDHPPALEVPPASEPDMPTLKLGSQGTEVKTLQVLLNANGANVYVDGIYGTETEDAVKAFQEANDLVVDGIVGPQTWQALSATTV